MNASDPLPPLPARPLDGHKGTFGTLAVVGGSAQPASLMIGAPALCARAAFRSGVGLVKIVTPEPIVEAVVSLEPSATGIGLSVVGGVNDVDPASFDDARAVIDGADAVVLGPGLGRGAGADELTRYMIDHATGGLVVDADALNALSDVASPSTRLPAGTIVTPHPGEYRRLARGMGVEIEPTDDATRLAGATALAERLGCIVVLKGMRTVVADATRSWVCANGHPCLATGGSGDVLAGVIGGLVAQHRRHVDPFDLARIGVAAHAQAGETWARSSNASGGMLARELADLIPSHIESHRSPA